MLADGRAPIGEGGKPVIRPYTPTSAPDTKGHFDLVVKARAALGTARECEPRVGSRTPPSRPAGPSFAEGISEGISAAAAGVSHRRHVQAFRHAQGWGRAGHQGAHEGPFPPAAPPPTLPVSARGARPLPALPAGPALRDVPATAGVPAGLLLGREPTDALRSNRCTGEPFPAARQPFK